MSLSLSNLQDRTKILLQILNSTNTDNPTLMNGGNCVADSISYKSSRLQNKTLACLMEFEMIVDL